MKVYSGAGKEERDRQNEEECIWMPLVFLNYQRFKFRKDFKLYKFTPGLTPTPPPLLYNIIDLLNHLFSVFRVSIEIF